MGTELTAQLSKHRQAHKLADKKEKHVPPSLFRDATLDLEVLQQEAKDCLQTLQTDCFLDVQKFRSLFADVKKRRFLSADESVQVDLLIKSFLDEISGHWTTIPALTCLDYLVRAFEIHRFLCEELILVALPFHDTQIFVRLVQVLCFPKTSIFLFLNSIRKTGTALARATLVEQCIRVPSLVDRIFRHACYVTENCSRVGTSAISFATLICVETLGGASVISEDLIRPLLTSSMKALRKPRLGDLHSGALAVLTQVAARSHLASDVCDTILSCLWSYLFKKGGPLIASVLPDVMAFTSVFVSLQMTKTKSDHGVFYLPKKMLDLVTSNIDLFLSSLIEGQSVYGEFDFTPLIAILVRSLLVETSVDGVKMLEDLQKLTLPTSSFQVEYWLRDSAMAAFVLACFEAYHLNSTDDQHLARLSRVLLSFQSVHPINFSNFASAALSNHPSPSLLVYLSSIFQGLPAVPLRGADGITVLAALQDKDSKIRIAGLDAAVEIVNSSGASTGRAVMLDIIFSGEDSLLLLQRPDLWRAASPSQTMRGLLHSFVRIFSSPEETTPTTKCEKMLSKMTKGKIPRSPSFALFSTWLPLIESHLLSVFNILEIINDQSRHLILPHLRLVFAAFSWIAATDGPLGSTPFALNVRRAMATFNFGPLQADVSNLVEAWGSLDEMFNEEPPMIVSWGIETVNTGGAIGGEFCRLGLTEVASTFTDSSLLVKLARNCLTSERTGIVGDFVRHLGSQFAQSMVARVDLLTAIDISALDSQETLMSSIQSVDSLTALDALFSVALRPNASPAAVVNLLVVGRQLPAGPAASVVLLILLSFCAFGQSSVRTVALKWLRDYKNLEIQATDGQFTLADVSQLPVLCPTLAKLISKFVKLHEDSIRAEKKSTMECLRQIVTTARGPMVRSIFHFLFSVGNACGIDTVQSLLSKLSILFCSSLPPPTIAILVGTFLECRRPEDPSRPFHEMIFKMAFPNLPAETQLDRFVFVSSKLDLLEATIASPVAFGQLPVDSQSSLLIGLASQGFDFRSFEPPVDEGFSLLLLNQLPSLPPNAIEQILDLFGSMFSRMTSEVKKSIGTRAIQSIGNLACPNRSLIEFCNSVLSSMESIDFDVLKYVTPLYDGIDQTLMNVADVTRLTANVVRLCQPDSAPPVIQMYCDALSQITKSNLISSSSLASISVLIDQLPTISKQHVARRGKPQILAVTVCILESFLLPLFSSSIADCPEADRLAVVKLLAASMPFATLWVVLRIGAILKLDVTRIVATCLGGVPQKPEMLSDLIWLAICESHQEQTFELCKKSALQWIRLTKAIRSLRGNQISCDCRFLSMSVLSLLDGPKDKFIVALVAMKFVTPNDWTDVIGKVGQVVTSIIGQMIPLVGICNILMTIQSDNFILIKLFETILPFMITLAHQNSAAIDRVPRSTLPHSPAVAKDGKSRKSNPPGIEPPRSLGPAIGSPSLLVTVLDKLIGMVIADGDFGTSTLSQSVSTFIGLFVYSVGPHVPSLSTLLPRLVDSLVKSADGPEDLRTASLCLSISGVIAGLGTVCIPHVNLIVPSILRVINRSDRQCRAAGIVALCVVTQTLGPFIGKYMTEIMSSVIGHVDMVQEISMDTSAQPFPYNAIERVKSSNDSLCKLSVNFLVDSIKTKVPQTPAIDLWSYLVNTISGNVPRASVVDAASNCVSQLSSQLTNVHGSMALIIVATSATLRSQEGPLDPKLSSKIRRLVDRVGRHLGSPTGVTSDELFGACFPLAHRCLPIATNHEMVCPTALAAPNAASCEASLFDLAGCWVWSLEPNDLSDLFKHFSKNFIPLCEVSVDLSTEDLIGCRESLFVVMSFASQLKSLPTGPIASALPSVLPGIIRVLEMGQREALRLSMEMREAATSESPKKKRQRVSAGLLPSSSTWWWFELAIPAMLALSSLAVGTGRAAEGLVLLMEREVVKVVVGSLDILALLPAKLHIEGFQGPASDPLDWVIASQWFVTTRTMIVNFCCAASDDNEHLLTIVGTLLDKCRQTNPVVRLAALRCLRSAWSELKLAMTGTLVTTLPVAMELIDGNDEEIEREARNFVMDIERLTGQSIK